MVSGLRGETGCPDFWFTFIKNIQRVKALTGFFLLLSLAGGAIASAQTGPNDGWRVAQRDTAPDGSWYAENGELIFDPARGHGSAIITSRSFTDFDLSFQFKISEGGNSGIKYFLLPNTSLGCEFQIIDDSRHPDASQGTNGNHKTGALYDIMPPDANKRHKPAGEWNTARIQVKGARVAHWLNGAKILEYERRSEAFKQAIAKSKFKSTPGFAEAAASPVLLQAHGDKVSYRNIKIKEL
jgi:hypothetical protein